MRNCYIIRMNNIKESSLYQTPSSLDNDRIAMKSWICKKQFYVQTWKLQQQSFRKLPTICYTNWQTTAWQTVLQTLLLIFAAPLVSFLLVPAFVFLFALPIDAQFQFGVYARILALKFVPGASMKFMFFQNHLENNSEIYKNYFLFLNGCFVF